MTSRSRPTTTPAADVAEASEPSAGRLAELPVRLRLALAVAGLGALALLAGPLAGLVTPSVPAGFASWQLLAVLALAPVMLAGGFALAGRPGAASAVLTSVALFAPGRALVDVQLLTDPALAARPELLLPASLTTLRPGTGVLLLMAGHALALLAGLLAYRENPESAPVDPAAAAAEDVAPTRTGSTQGRLVLALSVAGLAAVGLTGVPFHSDNPYLIPEATFDARFWVLFGGLLIAAAALTGALLAVSAAEPEAITGGLTGTALAIGIVALPPLVAGMAVLGLHPTWGPMLALLAALALVGLAAAIGSRGRADADSRSADLPDAEVDLPGQARLQAVSGALAVAAGVTALVGALTPLVEFTAPTASGSIPDLGAYPGRLLLPAGVLMLVLGGALFVRRLGAAARPTLAVASVTVLLGAAAALDTALTALDGSPIPLPLGFDAVHSSAGVGLWATVVALLCAIGAAMCAGLAGTVERGEVDLAEIGEHRSLFGPAVLAGVTALGAFGLPVLTAPGYLPPDLWAHFGTTSWGLLAALAGVLGAAALAPFSRSRRAVSLLAGAALVVGVRVLEMPLTAGRAAGSGPGIGLWFAVACLISLLAAVALAFRAANRPAVQSEEPVAAP